MRLWLPRHGLQMNFVYSGTSAGSGPVASAGSGPAARSGKVQE